MPHFRRRILLVSGAPGAGKSTLAGPLAAALGLPLFSKDLLKESLMDSLGGPHGDLAFSRRIGDAAMALLWLIARQSQAAILEANFRPRSDLVRRQIEQLEADITEVFCDCPPGECARRFAERSRTRTHPAHPLKELSAEMLAEYDGPIGIGTVFRVSTRTSVDIAELADRIRAAWVVTESGRRGSG